jgi:hypothetical protein
MVKRICVLFTCIMAVLTLIAAGCTSTKTVTAPAKTVTIAGGVTTLPAVTVTIASGTTVIPATVVNVSPATATLPSVPSSFAFLPTTPVKIPYDMGNEKNCLACHGLGTVVQIPLPPTWIGSVSGMLDNMGIFVIVTGSIQDHTGRVNADCLNCHDVF